VTVASLQTKSKDAVLRLAGAGVSDGAIDAARRAVSQIVQRHLAGRTEVRTAIPGLSIHGITASTEPTSYLYEPCFAFIACGAKRVVLGNETYVYDESHFLLTAVGLPTIVQVIDATESKPYYSMKMDIDLEMARDLITEVDQGASDAVVANTGLAIGPVTAPLAATVLRLMQLLDTPAEIPILARSIQRELLYRVLVSPVGERLRQAVQIETQTNRVAVAIRHIRKHLTQPVRIRELARLARMGESTLHHRFRDITGMSPLQYQKHFRLHEARRLMLNERLDASTTAYRVGYESVPQFNREYRRAFGTPPKSDVNRLVAKATRTRSLA